MGQPADGTKAALPRKTDERVVSRKTEREMCALTHKHTHTHTHTHTNLSAHTPKHTHNQRDRVSTAHRQKEDKGEGELCSGHLCSG